MNEEKNRDAQGKPLSLLNGYYYVSYWLFELLNFVKHILIAEYANSLCYRVSSVVDMLLKQFVIENAQKEAQRTPNSGICKNLKKYMVMSIALIHSLPYDRS